MEYININRAHAGQTGTAERQQQRTKNNRTAPDQFIWEKPGPNKKGATQAPFLLELFF
jgi:hypothetical protein